MYQLSQYLVTFCEWAPNLDLTTFRFKKSNGFQKFKKVKVFIHFSNHFRIVNFSQQLFCILHFQVLNSNSYEPIKKINSYGKSSHLGGYF